MTKRSIFSGKARVLTLIGGRGDPHNPKPSSDLGDLSSGARYIPDEVTLARKEGKSIQFITICGQCCWYWQMPDGSRIYHYYEPEYQRIAERNGKSLSTEETLPCHICGNIHTKGGLVNGPFEPTLFQILNSKKEKIVT